MQRSSNLTEYSEIQRPYSSLGSYILDLQPWDYVARVARRLKKPEPLHVA